MRRNQTSRRLLATLFSSCLLALPNAISCGEDGGAARDTEAEVEDVVDGTSDDVVDTPEPGDLLPANLPPTIELLVPADGATFEWATSVVLRASVSDDSDAPDALSVQWSSPIQGILFAGAPRADGVVEVVSDELVLGSHFLTLSAVDSDGAEATAHLMIEVMPEDGAPSISIAPLDPITSDGLVASVDDYGLDGSAGPLTVTWSWFRGPEPVDIGGAVIAPAETSKGETWRVEAVVSDGVSTTPAGVAQVVVLNALPACGRASIGVGSDNRLSCACDAREDLDADDPIGDRCAWTIDGAVVGGGSIDCQLDPSGALPGTVFGCTFVPFDGEEEGEPVAASAFVMPDASGNSAPLAPVVDIAPKFGQPGHTYTCGLLAPATDAQGDAISYTVGWSMAGHWNPSGDSWTVVPTRDLVNAAGGRPAEGDALLCRVIASDGRAESRPGVSGSVLLGTSGVSLGGDLGDVALDEPLGDNCWQDSDHALPECVPNVVCAVDIVACFNEDGSLRAPPTMAAVASLPGLGEVALSGGPTADGGWILSGAAPDVGPPTLALPLSGLTLTVTSDGAGGSTTTLSGAIALDGVTYDFVGARVDTFLSGQGADLTGLQVEVPLPDFEIAGTRLSGTLTLRSADASLAFVGTVTFEGVEPLAVSGAFELAGTTVVAAHLSAEGGATISGVSFSGETSLSLTDGVWQLALSGGSMTLPGGVELSLSGAVDVVASRLHEAVLDATVVGSGGAGGDAVSFAGVSFESGVEVRWSRDRFALKLEGGLLGPSGPELTVAGAIEVEDGVVVRGELSAGADLAIAGVRFSGEAGVSFDATSLRVALAAGAVDLPEGGAVSLTGEVVLEDGELVSAAFEGTGDATVGGVRFGGAISAQWSGGGSWAVGLSDGSVALPGGDEVTLAGSLALVEGRVVSGSFAAGTDVSFAGLRFAGTVGGSYRVSYDDLGNALGHALSLSLSGGKIVVAGTGELSLAGAVKIADGAVVAASFSAGNDVRLGAIQFAGEAAVSWSVADGLTLELAGGEITVAGSTLTVGGSLKIVDGELTCGELASTGAASTTIGGVTFELGIRYAAADKTCVWSDGTTTTSDESQLLASLAGGQLTVGPVRVTLAGNATLAAGTLACAVLEAGGGAALPVGGVSFALGARYAATGHSCPWTGGPAVGGALELTLNRGIVQVGGQEVSLSGAAVVAAGGIASASFTGAAALELPGGATGFSVAASYVAATSTFELALTDGQVEVAGTRVTLEGEARIVAGQVGCIALHSSGALATIGEATFEVGARIASAGFQCDWLDAPAEAHTFEVTLAGDVVVGGASFGFAGAGRVAGGALVCAELHADADVALAIGEARFDVGIRYAAAGATCAWDDGSETSADAPTLLAALSNGQLVLGGASLTLAGTGELVGGELTCVQLEAAGNASFSVGGVRFGAGARFAAAGATCDWMTSPAAVDTLEATLHDGAIAVAGGQLTLSGAAVVAGGAVRCADLTLEAGAELAFGGIAFEGSGRFIAAGATCDGESATADTLRLTLADGAVEVAGTQVVLSGSGEVVAGRVQCIAFVADGASPMLAGAALSVSGFYASAGATCAGAPGPVSEDTFALALALSAGPFAMSGLGRIEGGALACAELNASAGLSELAGVAFDVGGHYTAAGRSCTWADGGETSAEADAVFVATLKNGTLAVGGQTLSLAGEGELVGGAITCASLEALGALAIDVGGIDFSAGARYAAAGNTCGWSDGSRAVLQLTLHDGRVAVGATEVSLAGSAEIAGRKLTCATFESQLGAGIDLGGISFALGARYAAAGEACGWSDGLAERFELTLDDGALTIGANTFLLSGSARLEDRAIACAELVSSGSLALGGTTFTVGGRFAAANASCGWSDGTRTRVGSDTLSVYLSGGSVTVAGHTLALSGLGVIRGGRLACASLEASSSLAMDVAGVSFALGGARFVAGGETCQWPDNTTSSAVADTFSLALRDGKLAVGSVTLTLSGAAEITAGKVTCADLKAGGNARLDVGGVSFSAGARFAATGYACGWSDGAQSVLELTLDDGKVGVGGVQLGLRGAAAIAGGKLTCADFDVTAGAALAFGGVSFDAGARFAAAGETCGWSDGVANTLEILLKDGAIDVGGASLRLSGGGVVSDGKLGCATLTSNAAGATPVGGLAFTVSGRFAAAGQTCAWSTAPARANTFELALKEGRLAVGTANLSLSGAGTVTGGRLTCAELAAAGGASAAVGGISFDLGARYAAAGETCAWDDGSQTTSTTSTLLLALKNGTLAVGGQSLTLSGTASLEGRAVACANLDAVGVAVSPSAAVPSATVSVGGLAFDAGARFAAAGHACPWSDGIVAEDTLELTLRDGTVSAGGVALSLSGAAEIAGGKVTCADLAVDSDAALAFGGLSFDAHARFAAAGSACGWSDASADRLELALDGASVNIAGTRVALTGSGDIVAGQVRCVQFAAAGQAPLGGLTFDVGAHFAAAGATCEWTDGAVAANTFEVTLGGASVSVDGVGALTLSGSGRVEGGSLTCAELGAAGNIALGGVDFELGARFTRANTTCAWADGTSTTAAANTFTFALLDGALTVGPTSLKLSGAATLAGGKLTCAELDAAFGSASAVDVGGVSFAAGARYTGAGRTCTWRDGSATSAQTSTLTLTLKDGKVAVGPAHVTLAGTGEIAGNKLTCAAFEVQAGSDLSLGGIAFEAGARYAARGQTCGGWSDGAADTLALTLAKGALDVGGARVLLDGSATIAGGALTCAELQSTGGATTGFGGVSFGLGGRYAKAGATCSGRPAPAVDTFVLTLDDGSLVLGPTTLSLSGTAEVAAGKLTCGELEAAGGASVALGGVSFDSSARLAMAGSHCEWSDGTTSDPSANELLLGLRNGQLSVGGATLQLAGSGRIFGGQVACAELDAIGAAPISLAGVSFATGARYSGTGHACTWADGTTRPAGPQALQLTLKNGSLTVAGNTIELAGAAVVEAGKLTCAELTSAASLELAGLTFATGARYVAAGATCAWRDGSSTTSAAARMDLTLSDGRLAVGGVVIQLAGSGTLLGGKLACVELASSGSANASGSSARASVGGVAFDIGARFAAAGQSCGWSGGPVAADTFEVTLNDGRLALDGASIALSGTAQAVAGKLTCAELASTAGATVAIGGVSFAAGARFTAAGATCAWSPDPAPANRFELTLDDGQLTVGTTTLTLSGAASIVAGKLTCAELDAGGDAAIALGGVSFQAGAHYWAANETCVFSDGTVAPAGPSATLALALSDGRVAVAGNTLTLRGSGRISGGQVLCAELAAAADVAIAGVSFDASAHYTRAGASCRWQDGTTTQASATTLIVTLRDGRLEVGTTALSLSGEATLVASKVACIAFTSAGAASVELDGVSFDLGARYAGAGQSCAWTNGPVAADRFEVTLANGQLTLGGSSVSLSGSATISARKLTCAELAATGGATVSLAGATFDAGARFAAGGATCAWPDGTTSAPALDTLAVRLSGELSVAGQSMAVSGTGLLEGGTVTCAELAAKAGLTSLTLGGVSFSTGARYSAAGTRCTWSDGSVTAAPPTTYALQLALRDGEISVAGQTFTLSGTAELQGGAVTRAELAVGGNLSLAGVTFSASASYDAAADELVLRLHDGTLNAGPVAISLSGSGTIDTATRSLTCLELTAAGNASADFAGVAFDVGARYAAAGATCGWLTAPAPAATFEATLDNGTLSLGDGNEVNVAGTGTIVAGRITCATFESTGDIGGGTGAGVGFDGGARYAAAGEGCGWRTPTAEAVLAIDLSTSITIGSNVLTLVGAGSIGGGGVDCAELQVSGDVALAGVTFVAGARFVAADTTCHWSDGTTSTPGVQRLEVVLRDGRVQLGDGALTLSGIAQAENVAGGYRVPCIAFEANTTGAPFGGIAFHGSAHYTAAGRQCGWDSDAVVSDTLAVRLDQGALAIGSVSVELAGQALVTGGAVRCLQFAAAGAASGFAGISFAVDARFAAAGASCTWSDGSTAAYPAQTFSVHLDDGTLVVGAQSVALSGAATVVAGKLTCAELEAAGDVSVTLANASFAVDGHYAAAGATCPWLPAPAVANSFTLALDGAIAVDGNALALTGDATLVGGAITCASFTSTADIPAVLPIGGLSLDAGARYAAAGAQCGWNGDKPGERLQLALSNGQLALGGVTASVSGYADLVAGRLDCATLALAGDVSAAFGGVAMSGEARYAAAGKTCAWPDGSSSTGPSFTLALQGTAQIGATSVALRGSGLISNGAVKCLTFDAAAGAKADLDGLAVSVAATWAAANSACGDLAAAPTASFEVGVSGDFTVGPTTVQVSGQAGLQNGKLMCLDLAAQGNATVPLGGLDVTLAARFAEGGATCTWSDQTTSSPAFDTLYASLAGNLQVGAGQFGLSGIGLVVGGKITCAELAAAADASVALAGVTFAADARFAAANEACTWGDGTSSPAPAAATLRLALRDGRVQVGGNTVTLDGSAELDRATGITCASFAVTGDVATAGLTFAAAANYAAANRTCGAWDTSAAEVLQLAVHDGTLALGGNNVSVSGSLSIVNRRVTSGALVVDGAVALAGLSVTALPGKPAGTLAYSASYGASGDLISQSLALTVAGRVTIDGLGNFDVSGEGAVSDGRLDLLTLDLGASITLASVQISAQSIALAYQRINPDADNSSTLELVLAGGQLTVPGLGALNVSGRTTIVAGALSSLSLDVSSNLSLAGLTVYGGASLLYTNATRTLALTLTQARATVAGLGTLSLSGSSVLVSGALDALSLSATGALAIAGASFTGSATLDYRRNDPATGTSSLALRLTNARAAIAPLGMVAVSGAIALAGGSLASFGLTVTSSVSLAGVSLSGGLALSYSAAASTLRFSVDSAGVTVAGLGALRVSGSAVIAAGTLGGLSLQIDGNLSVAGLTLAGNFALVYAAADQSLALSVANATATIAGLDAAISISGSSRLVAGRLTSLSLAVAGGANLQGLALAGTVTLDYAATYAQNGTLLTHSLSLALSKAELALPNATVSLAGRLDIGDGAITCATFGPATVALSGVDFAASASYVAAGQTCGVLPAPAPSASFSAGFQAHVAIAGNDVSVTGAGSIADGRIDAIMLSASVSLSDIAGLQRAEVSASYTGGTLCFAGDVQGDLVLPLGAELRGISAHFCASGMSIDSVAIDVHVVAPNAIGDPLELLASAGYDGASSALEASVCLAGEDADGAPCCAGTSPSCPAVAWYPFDGALLPGLPEGWDELAVTSLAGAVAIGAGKLSIEARGAIDGSGLPQLVPGLALNSLEVWFSATAGDGGSASAGIGGIFAVPLGERSVDVFVKGAIAAGGSGGLSFTLSGGLGDPETGVSANVEPLAQFIGENVVEISYLNVTLAVSTVAGITFTFGGGADLSLPAPLDLATVGLQVTGQGSLGKRPGFYLIGGLCGLVVPARVLPEGFVDLALGGASPCDTPVVAVAIASRAYPDVEIAPNSTVRRGLTLAATIAPPQGVLEPLGLTMETFRDIAGLSSDPTIVAELNLDTTGVRLKGALNIPWQLIRPDWNLPAVRLLQFNQVAFEVLLKSPPILQFTGSVRFEPNHCLPDYASFIEAGLASDDSPFEAFDPARITCLDLPAPFREMPQQEPLTGEATFRYAPPNEFGGEIFINGIWYEPFWIPNVAIANPGIRLSLRLFPTPAGVPIPVPLSFGINGDVFWKRPYYDDAASEPVFPVGCTTDADCTGFGNCSDGACPARCEDGPDGDALPDTCHYSWPFTCADPDPEAAPGAPCIDTLEQPADVPASLASAGMTLFYDVFPSVSAILIPLPTLIVRRELNNLSTLDLGPALDDIKDGARNLLRWMEQRVPGVDPSLSPFPPCVDLDGDQQLDRSLSCMFPAEPLPNVLDALPLAFELDKLRVYFSTHEREIFGINFSPGIRADLDVALSETGAAVCDLEHPCEGGLSCEHGTCKRLLFMSGALGSAGVCLEGRTSPVSILDTITVKGDPFTKYADTHAGYVEVPNDPALETLPATVEAWFRHSATAGQWQSVLRQTGVDGDGYEVEVGDPAPACNAHYDGCDSGRCSLVACEGVPGRAVAPCGDGGQAGVCSACPPGTDPPCDAPCLSDAECVGVTGVTGATCVGYVPHNPDADVMYAAKADADFDMQALITATATACPQDANLEACIAAGLTSALPTIGGTSVSSACAGCFAGYVSCEERAAVRVKVTQGGGSVTRTVVTAPLARAHAWSHVAVDFDSASGEINVYVDGAKAKTSDDSGLPSCDAPCSCDSVCAADSASKDCSACVEDLYPEAADRAAAASTAATDCASCESALDAWLTNAPAAGHWPKPGVGATVRMGAGVLAIDDVRLWSGHRTAEQIAAQKSSLPQDATPETLGDCSNAGPGTCAVGAKMCDNDFDCDTGACVGAIPSGTCRANADCSAAASCDGYVPPTQRWAFDANLIARYEFDYDSYKSTLDRAWNTRYRGDPDGLDCVATPQAPPVGACGLIGTPCKDYDVDGSFKLHGRYVNANWVAAVDDPGATEADDLFFKLNIPFGTAIFSEGGIQLRGGVAVTLPDWLPAPDMLSNGGVRADVALIGINEVHGEVYTKPYDYLEFGLCAASATPCTTNADCTDPVFGLDDITYCRDDGFCTIGPCLGRLSISGYGPNGIDDGIDDGFYARSNLKAKPIPTFQAGARVSLETFATPREDLAFASYELQCPPGQNCQAADDYRLSLATGLAIDLPLPFTTDEAGAPARLLQICGNAATFKPGIGDTVPDWLAEVSAWCPAEGQAPSFGTFIDGSVTVLSQTLSGSILITDCGLKVRSALDLGGLTIGDLELPPFGTMSAEVTMRYVPFRMCAEGYLNLDIELPEVGPAKLIDLQAEVTADTCVGEPTKYAGKDSGNFVRILTGSPDGTPSQASIKFLSLDGGPALFEMNGAADICFGDGDRVGMPGVRACADDHMRVCGDLQLLDGVVQANGCLALAATPDDVTFSMRTNASVDVAGLLPSSTTELFVEMCARGQRADWSEAEGKLVCLPHADPSFKMVVPRVTLRFQSDLDVAGGSFGNVDVLLTADLSAGIYLSGNARYVSGTSTAFGFDAWAPDFCEIGVTLDVPNGGQAVLTGTSPKCSPYCFVASDCVDSAASCVLGKCQVCGDAFCAFGENSLNCPGDCGYPAGASCADDQTCASDNCWTYAEQLDLLIDDSQAIDPGVCLPCVPGVSGCGPDEYCDPFQFFECRAKAPYGEYCAWNEVCQSSKCKFDVFWGGARCAECWEEGDCTGGQWCDWYTATPNPVPQGLSTAPTYQCRGLQPTGGKCGYDAIIGANDDHCEAGNFCDVDGTCHAKAENDVVCTGDRVCQSGHCCFEGVGICEECCAKADCGAGLGCYGNVCRKGIDGELCVEDAECGSNHCVFVLGIGVCTTPVANGVACGADEACISEHCCGGTCRECCAGADCWATNPENGCYGNVCRPGNDGDGCSNNQECASDNCVAGFCRTRQPNGYVGCALQDGQCQSGHCCFDTCQACCGDIDCAGLPDADRCYDNTCRLGYDNGVDACNEAADCYSGRCNDALCGCTWDEDCPGDLRCYSRECRLGSEGEPCSDGGDCSSGLCGYSGRLVRNACYSYLGLPTGAQCNVHENCTSGYCDPLLGYTCAAPTHTVGNWGSCTQDNQCIAGLCYGGVCRCTGQADCTVELGAGHYCDEGTWLLGNYEGQCHATLPDDGAPYCESAAWCQSGRCDWSPRLGRNICWSPVAQPYGATCNLDGHCASWSCNEAKGNTCDPVAYSIANNARNYCEDDAWCDGGWAGGYGFCRYSLAASMNVCVAAATRDWGDACDVDMQCGAHPNLRCMYWPIGGGLVGRPDIGIGYYCGYP